MSKYISNIETPKISIAPMIDRTDKHFRYFLRGLTKKSLLYTEMITAQAIMHGDLNKLLDFNPMEKPLSLQVAGCTPEDIYKAVKMADAWDYDEVNLNVGCPSDRVSGNQMGAVLMAYPELVKEMVCAMREATKKPVTVKHRIGIDGTGILPEEYPNKVMDDFNDMVNFITKIEEAKVDRFTIHARIAILAGLSPRENREVPPLRYDEVYDIKKMFPHLQVEINGGIRTPEQIREQLKHVDGVMIGRASYENPFIVREFDQFFEGGSINDVSRRDIVEYIIPYIEELEENGQSPNLILKHTLELFHGVKGAKLWKQIISPPYKDEKVSKKLKKVLSMIEA